MQILRQSNTPANGTSLVDKRLHTFRSKSRMDQKLMILFHSASGIWIWIIKNSWKTRTIGNIDLWKFRNWTWFSTMVEISNLWIAWWGFVFSDFYRFTITMVVMYSQLKHARWRTDYRNCCLKCVNILVSCFEGYLLTSGVKLQHAIG